MFGNVISLNKYKSQWNKYDLTADTMKENELPATENTALSLSNPQRSNRVILSTKVALMCSRMIILTIVIEKSIMEFRSS